MLKAIVVFQIVMIIMIGMVCYYVWQNDKAIRVLIDR